MGPAEWGGSWAHVVWMGQERWSQMKSSERNISPATAPRSQGLSGSEPLTSMSPKKTTFQSLGSIPSGMFSPSLTKRRLSEAKQGSDPLNSPTHSIMSSPKLWQKASISRLAEEFFWIGGSVVAQPKWRLGQMGKTLTSEIHITFFFLHKCLKSGVNRSRNFLVNLKYRWKRWWILTESFEHSVVLWSSSAVETTEEKSREADNEHMDSRQSCRISLNDVPGCVTWTWASDYKQRLPAHRNSSSTKVWMLWGNMPCFSCEGPHSSY